MQDLYAVIANVPKSSDIIVTNVTVYVGLVPFVRKTVHSVFINLIKKHKLY